METQRVKSQTAGGKNLVWQEMFEPSEFVSKHPGGFLPPGTYRAQEGSLYRVEHGQMFLVVGPSD